MYGKTSFQLLIKCVQETPQTIKTVDITLGFLQELEGKILLLKIRHTWI